MLPLEEAILNLMELAAVEDAPPFLRLLRKRGGPPSGGGGPTLQLGWDGKLPPAEKERE